MTLDVFVGLCSIYQLAVWNAFLMEVIVLNAVGFDSKDCWAKLLCKALFFCRASSNEETSVSFDGHFVLGNRKFVNICIIILLLSVFLR